MTSSLSIWQTFVLFVIVLQIQNQSRNVSSFSISTLTTIQQSPKLLSISSSRTIKMAFVKTVPKSRHQSTSSSSSTIVGQLQMKPTVHGKSRWNKIHMDYESPDSRFVVSIPTTTTSTTSSSFWFNPNILHRRQSNTVEQRREQGIRIDNTMSNKTTVMTTSKTKLNNAHKPIEHHNNIICSHGMPWTKSICSESIPNTNTTSTTRTSKGIQDVFYMPFYIQQIKYMERQLTNLRQLPVLSKTTGTDMSYRESIDGTKRIYTAYYTSDEYELIRLTVLDGGTQTQVFTSLWYPNIAIDVPLLGIDLLQFNSGTRHLCISDFQPLHPNEEQHDCMYEDELQPIKEQYPTLHGTMSNRFYNSSATYFSKRSMLFGRHNSKDNNNSTSTSTNNNSVVVDPNSMIFDQLFPAIRQYMETHVSIVQEQFRKQRLGISSSSRTSSPHRNTKIGIHDDNSNIDETKGDNSNNNNNEQQLQERIQSILQRRAEYDTYSAHHDPAHALLGKMFGTEWADDYVYDILFPTSTRTKSTTTKTTTL